MSFISVGFLASHGAVCGPGISLVQVVLLGEVFEVLVQVAHLGLGPHLGLRPHLGLSPHLGLRPHLGLHGGGCRGGWGKLDRDTGWFDQPEFAVIFWVLRAHPTPQ